MKIVKHNNNIIKCDGVPLCLLSLMGQNGMHLRRKSRDGAWCSMEAHRGLSKSTSDPAHQLVQSSGFKNFTRIFYPHSVNSASLMSELATLVRTHAGSWRDFGACRG